MWKNTLAKTTLPEVMVLPGWVGSSVASSCRAVLVCKGFSVLQQVDADR